MAKFTQFTLSKLKNVYRTLRYNYRVHLARDLGQLPQKMPQKQESVLFLLPEAGISSYINTLVTVAKQLKMQGVNVYFIRCYNIFERCMFMDSESLPIEAESKAKEMLCTYCFNSFKKHVIGNNLPFFDLRHFTDEKRRQEIKEKIASHNEPFDFTYEDINFSGILEYNFYLYLKKANLLNLSSSELKLWQQQLTSLYVGYNAIKKLIEEYQISHVVMYDQYSLNSIIKIYAQRNGIVFSNLSIPFHKDVDPTRIRVVHKDFLIEEHETIKKWSDFKNLYLLRKQLKEVVDDLIFKMSKRGTYSYSPSKSKCEDISELLTLDKRRKTIIAYPSSPDETDSIINSYKQRGMPLDAPDDAFIDQFEWLDDLIEFVEASSEFQLVVRLHPRLAPNHREKWGCPAIADFIAKYSKPYQHVRIIWPQEKISSFDLAEIADIVTVSWSSMGIFMARLGIPVVSGLKVSLPFPNEDFLVFCKEKEAYFSTIRHLSNIPIDLHRLKAAYRWYHMRYLGSCVDMSDVIGNENTEDILGKNAGMLLKAIVQQKNVLEMNLSEQRAFQKENDLPDEDQELKAQLYRLIHFFMTNKDDFSITESINIQSYPAVEKTNNKYTLVIQHNGIEYFYQGEKYKKYSPMILRLIHYVQALNPMRLDSAKRAAVVSA